MTDALFAGVEVGGTKILCAVARGAGVIAEVTLPTHAPEPTFAAMADFFRRQAAAYGPVRAGGVASFGPLDLDPRSPHYGRITVTPKAGWSGVDMRGRIAAMLDAPVAIDTDVNCAALAELHHGAGRGLARLCYITVGTGIGMGFVADRHLALGPGHPEGGHIRVPRAPGDDFRGICPSHGDCLEGLASGPAMAARWGISAEELPDEHPGWDMAAHYLASLCATLTYLLRPERIVLGGGVLGRAGLLPRVRARFAAQLAGYALDRCCADAARYLVRPGCAPLSSGLAGALVLAREFAGG